MMHQLSIVRRYFLVFFLLAGALSLPIFSPCMAHELKENRASLILRNETTLFVTLYLDMPDALHKALAPERDAFEFMGYMSSLNNEDFSKQWLLAIRKLENGIHINAGSGESFKVTGINWGEPHTAQKLFQETIMRSVVEKNRHLHSEPYEVKFQINAKSPITSLNIEMPAALRPLTIVTNRIRQSRLGFVGSSAKINF